MSDPVAAKSTFLCMYMSSHPDTLVAYVKHFGSVREDVSSAQMTSIDTKGMTLSYQTTGKPSDKKQVYVEFDPPLTGYEEVKPRLITMKLDAEEALGMVRAPQVTEFRFPTFALVTVAAMTFLVYVTMSPSAPDPSGLFQIGYLVRTNVPSWAVTASWGMVVVMHGSEALYSLALCKKHRTPLVTGMLYTLGTALLGLPILSELRRQAQTARIESVMKGK
ncbi:uncharacterized protein FIBRA_02586 [Fibroporia radiculosa]|uniref:DUF2470 domain-containing protein n=1 Tax=Fibroporia radiculosa TaxID=599839 RepID=J4HV63_9APHY|nr:uncharacterized protein FIBRA_02586 [Fibroporia radiculosa]CCM00552.1 predicted protein [Fibroporia radiculosa]